MSRSRTADRSASEHQRGSAAVEFVLVAPLVLLIFAALVQIGIAVHVRATLVACAAEGARAGAEATDVESAALAGTRRALRSSIAQETVQDISVKETRVEGARVVGVTIAARLPLFGLLGPSRLQVTGRALREAV